MQMRRHPSAVTASTDRELRPSLAESVSPTFPTRGRNMKRLSKLVPFSFVGVILALALLPASAPANTAAATISFVGGGTLLDDGSVDVTLHYSCLPGVSTPGGIEVTLQQGVFFGENLAPAICDGRNHSVLLNMAPGPFVAGIAAGRASVFNDNGSATASANDQVTIR
jgi:hypothetical protein